MGVESWHLWKIDFLIFEILKNYGTPQNTDSHRSTRKHSPHAVDSHMQPLAAREHGSGVLRSHLEFEIVARANFMVSGGTFAFPSQPVSKSLCFELCIASNCALRDLTSTVRCHVRI